MKTDKCIDSLLVVGLGLIGGSFAASLKRVSACERILGYDQNEDTIHKAVELGVIDQGCAYLSEGVTAADLIMICVPVLAIESVLRELAQFSLVDKVITDVGSSKMILIRAAESVFGSLPVNFVPGHPIAGSEKSGIEATVANLFIDHNVILTPLPDTDIGALSLVKSLWEACGSVVIEMSATKHDKVLAKTSHLPHFIAFSFVDTLVGGSSDHDIFEYAAGGFRDFTRIAGGDPTMWHDVAMGNSVAVLEELQHFSNGIDQLRTAIIEKDSNTLINIFSRAKTARHKFTQVLAKRNAGATINTNSKTFIVRPSQRLSGELRVPGDKSISHRSIMLGAIAEGVTVVNGFLEGEDALATLRAFRDMGVIIDGPDAGCVVIHGVGMNGLKAPSEPINLGNAGTAMRLMAGLMAAQNFDVTLVGDKSLSGRPMSRVVTPLTKMGALIKTADGGKPPLDIKGGRSLQGIHYQLPIASAQVQSCLLLAGMYAQGETVTEVPGVVRDHTSRMLKGFGYSLRVEEHKVAIDGGGKLIATNIDVPADISSAAFFMVAASIAKESEVRLSHVGMNPTRSGVIDILRLMGADISLENEMLVGGEPVADVLVRASDLKGIKIPERLVPIAIDEFPVLFVAAACADGVTELTGARELRVKESDRIQAMADGLQILGVDAQPQPDGMVIIGKGDKDLPVFSNGTVDSQGDHRIAMAFAVASLRAVENIHILDCDNVATSFPDFVTLASKIGMNISVMS